MPTFLHDVLVRGLVTGPVLAFCLAAGPWLVRRWGLNGWAACGLGFTLAVASMAFGEWQARPLLRGEATSGWGFCYLYGMIVDAANKASAAPVALRFGRRAGVQP